MSVLHEHAKRKGDFVPVRVVLEIPKEGQAPLVKALSEQWRVLSISGATNALPFAFLLLGHVFESQVKDITDAAFQCGAEVRRFTAEIAAREQPSAALVEITAPDRDTLEATRARVRDLAAAKGLTYVEALGGQEP